MKVKEMCFVLCVFCTIFLIGLVFQTAANAADYFAKSVPVYRLTSHVVDGAFGYTNDYAMMTSVAEMNNAINNGWKSDGIACWTSPAQIPGTVPLYRMYKASASDHFYVSTKSERDSAVGLGYSQEGIVGYVYPKNINPPVAGTVPLYRFLNGGSSYHRYSLNPQVNGGEKYEGIECYVWPSEKALVSLSLTSPRAYEELKGLSEYNIAWNPSVKGGYVALYYSTDSGNNWTPIGTGITNTGIAKWKVPNIDTQRGRIRIVWTDNLIGTSNLLAKVESPYDFKIKRTSILPSVKSPTAIKQ